MQLKENLTISLIGKYWVGKSTYAEDIANLLGLSILSIRKCLHEDPIIKQQFISGNVLIPDSEVFRVLNKQNLSWKLIDWFPRTIGQAKYLVESIENLLILILDTDDEIIEKRINNRLNCEKCLTSYSIWDDLSEWDKCSQENCWWRLIKRIEDVFLYEERKKSFLKDTKPAIEYINNLNKAQTIYLPNINIAQTKEYIKKHLKLLFNL